MPHVCELLAYGPSATIDSRTYSSTELISKVKLIAAALVSEGCMLGDVVASVSTDQFLTFILYYAVTWVGATFMPLNPKLSNAEIENCLQTGGAKFCIASQRHGPPRHHGTVCCSKLTRNRGGAAVRAYVKHIPEIALLCEKPNMLISLVPLIPPAPLQHDPAVIMFTSGSERSKGVMLSHANILFQAQNKTSWLTGSPVYLHMVPMFHVACFVHFAITQTGGRHVFIPSATRFNPELVAQIIAAEGVDTLLCVPTMIRKLNVSGGHAFGLVRLVVTGGESADSRLANLIREMFPASRWIHTYGMTECASTIAFSEPGVPFVGQPVVRNSLEISPGGEIRVRGPHVMMGYVNGPKVQHVDTGDLGELTEGNQLVLLGRIKTVIKTGGEAVHCCEVRDALLKSPLVQDCKVFGIPCSEFGEAVAASVLLSNAATNPHTPDIVAHLQQICKTTMANFKCPRRFFFPSLSDFENSSTSWKTQ